jgi:hypothetical protein
MTTDPVTQGPSLTRPPVHLESDLVVRHLVVLLCAVALAGAVGGCGAGSSSRVAAAPCGSSVAGVHQGVPLAGMANGGNAPTLVRAGAPTPQPALKIPLEVSAPVTLDCVILDPFRSLPGLPAPALPRLDAAHVVTPGESHQADGYRVEPSSLRDEPGLVLTVSTAQGIAFNQDTQVFYHSADGTRYRTVYLVQFVVCVKGQVPPRSCLRAFPRYVRTHDAHQQSASPS